MGVTPEGFARLTKIILELANQTCEGKTLFILEGGYHLQGLRDSVKAVLLELLGESDLFKGRSVLEEKIESGDVDSIIQRVKETHKPYWPSLSR